MTTKIDFNKLLQTREGNKVRIYAMDGSLPKPIHGACMCNGAWCSRTWRSDGVWDVNESETHLDLVNVPETRELFINMYDDGNTGCIYHSKKEADAARGAGCEACVKVAYTVGDGL